MATIDPKYLRASDGTGSAVLAHVTVPRLAGATTLKVDNIDNWPPFFIATSGILGSNDYITEASKKEFRGHLSGTDIIIDGFEAGFTDNGDTTQHVVVIKQTTGWANLTQEALTEAQKFMTPTGAISPFAGRVAPSNWLMCAGQAVSRSTYAALFNALTADLGAATISIAAPATVTAPAHGLATGDLVYLTTTGALPSGLAPNTAYFAIVTDANNFRLASTFANAVAGTAITTTGSQSGVHTVRFAPYGIGDGTSTFNVPNMKGRMAVGLDSADTDFNVLGKTGGQKTVQAHTHQISGIRGGINWAAGSSRAVDPDVGGVVTTNTAGTGTTNMNPYMALNYIIKT